MKKEMKQKIEKKILKEIRNYIKPGGAILTCCINNPQLEQIKKWWEKLTKINKQNFGA